MSTMTKALPLANETEVTAKAQRRRFTAAEKLRVPREAYRCTKPGELSAVLRREGLVEQTREIARLQARLEAPKV